eukprot:TRINITY_DN1944_c0_g1_i1.p1 TRINITY_DN1944_c0_g1~~TRINITY_DN1944_c0_g1_i1.p1  ORF type:complete len:342 (+),score=64.63 TRINITY_DN1944_c0_g1_i1:28-1026(+)
MEERRQHYCGLALYATPSPPSTPQGSLPRASSSAPGISSARVIDKEHVAAELFCPICSDLINPQDGTQALPCGHLFCNSCIMRVVRENGECPQDRQPLMESQLKKVKEGNPFVYRLLGRTRVRCQQHDDGCDWVGELSEHCTHSMSCKKAVVSCPRCSCEMTRELLGMHSLGCEDMEKENERLRQKLAEKSNDMRTLMRKIQEKDVELASVREKLEATSSMNGSLSRRVSDLSSRLRHLEAFDWSYSYGGENVVELAQLIARGLMSKPEEIDRNRIFNCIKKCTDEWRRDTEESLCVCDLRFLLATAAASNWFTYNQMTHIQEWFREVCAYM